ncbi:tyrosine-type recombinase/integrase [Streptococcus minor]|uniref:tyrosine-type recombinase/integrase n=1 Tax=Streptococcus minor TaxID=229549 RepID=UPI00037D809A|nr:tyrosine-type recombinase/integrase [Streptococcus minor]
MYPEYLADGRVKYIAEYKDPYTNKRRRATTIVPSDSSQNRNKAAKILQERIRQNTLSANASDITFYELYQRFYDEWKLSVKHRTLYTYRHIDKRLLDTVEDIPVKNINKRYLQDKINLIFSQGFSTNTMKLYVGRIKAIMGYGLDKDYIQNDITRTLKSPKKKMTLEEKRKKKLDYISKDEFRTVFEHYAKKTNKRTMRIVAILYMTGLRFGELQALTKDDIDFENGTIHIRGTYDKTQGRKTTTKTERSERSILAPRIVLNYILDQIADNALKLNTEAHRRNTEGYIFFNEKGLPYSNSAFDISLKTNAKHFGLSSHITAHTFRHSHISLLAEMGIPLAAIMDRVGHADSKTTIQIYTHVTQKMANKMIDRLNEIQI